MPKKMQNKMKEFEISDVRFQQIAKFLLFCFPLKVYDTSTSEQPLKLSSVNFTMQTLCRHATQQSCS